MEWKRLSFVFIIQNPIKAKLFRDCTTNGRAHQHSRWASDFEAAMCLMEHNLKSETAQAIFDKESGKTLKYRALLTHPKYRDAWTHSSANEFGRLAQGVGTRINGTNTIFFIGKHEVPADRRRDITYGKFVCEYKPNKDEKERTRIAEAR